MKRLALFCSLAVFVSACGSSGDSNSSNPTGSQEATSTENTNPTYDPERGEGNFKDVKLPAKLDGALAANGEKISDLKCSSCHKLTDEKLVGPGWKGVTTRHKPEWILNFITNPDAMIDKDPKAQAMLELCMVRMPNQSLSDNDAMALLEYMRKNDGVK
jgi:cytochrome c551/c552